MTRRGETKYVNVDGSDVAYQVVGKGALDLVYIGVPDEWQLYAVKPA